MNRLNEIINNANFEDGKLYLLEKPTDDFGFFYQNMVVYFGKKSVPGTETESIETSYLDMNLNIYIQSVTTNASFESGNYDLLAYKDDLSTVYFDVFYNICNSYCKNTKGISFFDFFNSLVEMFKKSRDSNSNLIGLIGELFMIKCAFVDYSKDISDNWHLVGRNSKFDFSFEKFNLEVKTTIKSEKTFLLKHSQIFNNQKNYIAVVSIIETGEGESLETLHNYFATTNPFAENVNFQIAIANEMLKISNAKDKKREFKLDDIAIYYVEDMETITQIPLCISNVEYEYDFTDVDEKKFEDLFK